MLDAVTGWDWFVLIVAVLSVGIGLIRGLVRTVFALAAWVVGLLGVPLASPPVIGVLPEAVPRPVVYLVVFLLLFVAVRMLGSLAARGLRGLGLGGVDRLLGAVLGTVRAVIVILLAALGAHLAGFSEHPSWTQAFSRPLLDALVHKAEPFLPERLSGVRRT
ncbi:MAG: Pur regulon 18 kDa protein [Pseudomonadota bacterium]|jgi:membrane protein required for colicin V production